MRPWTGGRPPTAASSRGSFNGATALRPWTAFEITGARLQALCFNGATALRPWTAAAAGGFGAGKSLQWGHGLAAVDGARPSPPAQDWDCFNGATALRPWTAVQNSTRCNARPASMGPRPCGRGRQASRAAARRPSRGFNGATALRPWTGGRGGRTRVHPSSFNGATALRPWTARLPGPPGQVGRASMGPRPCGRGRRAVDGRCLSCAAMLQWGHGLAAVDGHTLHASMSRAVIASMGPRPCGRGRRTRAASSARHSSFNGATALRPWTAACRPDTGGRHECFNGATALRPWTAISPCRVCSKV